MYKVQDLTPDQKTRYDQEIAELKGQLADVKELLEGFRVNFGQLMSTQS